MKILPFLLSFTFCVALITGVSSADDSGCHKRDFGNDSFVCVCDTLYCDWITPLGDVGSDVVVHYISDMKTYRFNRSEIPVQPVKLDHDEAKYVISVNRSKIYQKVIGFGNAFTDAAGIMGYSLGKDLGNTIVESYYGHRGLGMNLGRIPIGGCDFSTRPYTYADKADDFNLDHFQLQEEDIKFKIPALKHAQKVSDNQVKFFGSAWTAPAWMKTNNQLIGKGHLIGLPGGVYYKLWAKYYVKFLDGYKKEGIPLWGLTAGNEPTNGWVDGFTFNCMAFSPETQRDFIKMDLVPALRAAGYNDTKIMILDDQRFDIPFWIDTIMQDPEAAALVDGLAIHWYGNSISPSSTLDKAAEKYPEIFLLNTEACHNPPRESYNTSAVLLGSWERGMIYAIDILNNLVHSTSGWIEWNFAVDMNGGPNWTQNLCDAPIVVHNSTGEFFKQPMFYAMGHFSKFLPADTVRVDSQLIGDESPSPKMKFGSFVTPDGSLVVIVLNSNDFEQKLLIQDHDDGIQFEKVVTANSISTFIHKKDV